MSSTLTSIQEAAVSYVNEILNQVNAAAEEVIGVDALWFRLVPDQRNRDVIFQTYTLYGVEDCPMSIRVVYTDTSYDDAAITYQIMGLQYAVPLTIEISVETWKQATGNDGTIPQKGDIVFIPMSRKLLQVVSMTPVKAVAAQLTSYKMNMEVYKPARSVIVGDNLREAIEATTTNLEERFGNELDHEIRDIVDDSQLSIFDSTEMDHNKSLSSEMAEDTGVYDIKSVVRNNLTVDGHLVARGYYDMNRKSSYIVRYSRPDSITSDSERCYSCWVRLGDFDQSQLTRNIKDPENSTLTRIKGEYHLTLGTSLGKNFKEGDKVLFSRGQVVVPGVVVNTKEITLNQEITKSLCANSATWYKLPGFTVSKGNDINLLKGRSSDGGTISIDIRGNCYVTVTVNGTEKAIRILQTLSTNMWYGLVLNMGSTVSLSVFSGDGSLDLISKLDDQKWNGWDDMSDIRYEIGPSESHLTNIRLYTASNTDLDKQIKDMVTYNITDDSRCIINDTADVYLNKPYMGIQR